jgi:hypothetical protein
MKNKILGALALCSFLILPACGGGGSTPGLVSTPVTSQSSSKGTVKVSFVVAKPTTASTSASTKHTDFVDSVNSASYNIYLNTASVASGAIGASNPACVAQTPPATGYACSVSFAAPVGSDTIGVILEDSTGYVLSDGETTSNITSGSNTVAVTLGGVATSANVIPISNISPNSVTMGLPVSGYIQPVDHDYYTIGGPGNYSDGPLVLVETDSSGILTLTGTSMAAPVNGGNNPFTLACNAPGTATVAVKTGNQYNFGPVFGFPYTASNYPAGSATLWSATITCNSPASVNVTIDGKARN